MDRSEGVDDMGSESLGVKVEVSYLSGLIVICLLE